MLIPHILNIIASSLKIPSFASSSQAFTPTLEIPHLIILYKFSVLTSYKVHFDQKKKKKQVTRYMTKKFKDRMTKKEEKKKLIVSSSRFWLLHNQDWALDILCTMIAHTPKESPARPTNNVLKKTIKQQIREYPI